MNPINDGGPAFPQLQKGWAATPVGGGTQVVHDASGGMTLRDYLAAKAMQGYGFDPQSKPEWIAKWSYDMADAMLKARQS